MHPIRSTSFRDDEARSPYNEDHNTCSVLRSRTEEEKESRRREWQRQLEREEHKLKQVVVQVVKCERNLAQALKYAEEKPSRHSRSKSGSESPSHLQYRDKSASTTSKSDSLLEKLDVSTSETVPLFRGPQNTQINSMELRRIKVKVHRNIPVKRPATELKRDILNPEDVIVKRRKGEGSKSIFDREEIKKAAIKTNEIEEQRTVAARDKEQSYSTAVKWCTSIKQSLSKNPNRKNSYSSGHSPSYKSRYHERSNERYYERIGKNSDRNRNRDRDEDRNRDRDRDGDWERKRERESENRDRERERKRERDGDRIKKRRDIAPDYIETSRIDKDSNGDKDGDKNRDRGRDRDGDRERDRKEKREQQRDRDRTRNRKDIVPDYIETPIPIPYINYNHYYGSFPPGPIVVRPIIPLRRQIPPMGRGIHPALMPPVRPFLPRFAPDMYRLRYPSPYI